MRELIYILIASVLIGCSKPKPSGYQDKISYFTGENMEVYLASESDYEKNIRLYNINEVEVDKIKAELTKQPKVNNKTWYKTGYQYKKTFDFNTSKLKSGIYYFETSSPFVIKNPKKKNDVLMVYPSNTVNAYNKNGGRSTYTNPMGVKLSRRRPTQLMRQGVEFWKWLPEQNFNVDYIADEDLDDYSNIKNYKVIIISGHNEYWTRQGRRNFDKYINDGGNALILSGNTMWKQVRYEDDKVICYNQYQNDSLFHDSLRTSNYGLSYLKYPIESSIGLNFIKGGYGIQKDNGWDGYKIVEESILLENTNLIKGDVLSVPSEECDGADLIFENNKVTIDTNFINFYRQKLIGYDKGFRLGETNPAFIVFKKTKNSGIVINVGSNTWCLHGFKGEDEKLVKQITTNCINALLKNKKLF